MAKPVLRIIIGSTRPGRVAPAVADWIADRAREHGGFDVQVTDLAELNLPLLDEPNHLRSQWMDAQEREKQRTEVAKASDKVRPDMLRAQAGSIEFDELLRRTQTFRLVLLTLLAQSLPWMRKLQDQCERASVASGVVDALHGDIPELANRIRSWLGTGNHVAIASDQPHRVAV